MKRLIRKYKWLIVTSIFTLVVVLLLGTHFFFRKEIMIKEYKNEYYIDKLIYNFILKNEILVRSITVDNGLEFQALGIAAKKLGVKLYKCDPYCSFQRGTNERMNAIVRRFIPKGDSMKLVPQTYLNDICFMINSMPRKIFDFKSSFEVEAYY